MPNSLVGARFKEFSVRGKSNLAAPRQACERDTLPESRAGVDVALRFDWNIMKVKNLADIYSSPVNSLFRLEQTRKLGRNIDGSV